MEAPSTNWRQRTITPDPRRSAERVIHSDGASRGAHRRSRCPDGSRCAVRHVHWRAGMRPLLVALVCTHRSLARGGAAETAVLTTSTGAPEPIETPLTLRHSGPALPGWCEAASQRAPSATPPLDSHTGRTNVSVKFGARAAVRDHDSRFHVDRAEYRNPMTTQERDTRCINLRDAWEELQRVRTTIEEYFAASSEELRNAATMTALELAENVLKHGAGTGSGMVTMKERRRRGHHLHAEPSAFAANGAGRAPAHPANRGEGRSRAVRRAHARDHGTAERDASRGSASCASLTRAPFDSPARSSGTACIFKPEGSSMRYQADALTIDSLPEQGQLVVRWLGRSDGSDPSRTLQPLLDAVNADLLGRESVEFDFARSST